MSPLINKLFYISLLIIWVNEQLILEGSHTVPWESNNKPVDVITIFH